MNLKESRIFVSVQSAFGKTAWRKGVRVTLGLRQGLRPWTHSSRKYLNGITNLVPRVSLGLRKYSVLLALIKSGNILWGMQASPRGFIPDFAGCCASGGGVPPPGQKPRLRDANGWPHFPAILAVLPEKYTPFPTGADNPPLRGYGKDSCVILPTALHTVCY